MYCSKCGTRNPDDARFCGACGAPLGAGVSAREVQFDSGRPMPAAPSKRDGVPKAAIVAVGIVLAAVVAVGVCFALGVFGAGLPSPLADNGQDAGDAESQAAGDADEKQSAEYSPEAVALEHFDYESNAGKQADREQTALAFAEQFYTNAVMPDIVDDTKIESIGNADVWAGLVEEYIEPGSAAEEKFEKEMLSKQIPGHEAAVIALGSEVVSSSADEVVVKVDFAGTQNPYPGWSKEHRQSATFACTFADSGLISEYSLIT